MSWAERSLEAFEQALASSDPTPGGGTAAAVALGQAAALVSMVASLTLQSDRWTDAHEAAEQARNVATEARSHAARLADEDSAAFDQVMAAFRLPKTNEAETEARREAIRSATLHAAEVPMETAELARALIDEVLIMIQRGNVNAVSDAGMASLLATAAAKGALFNVNINLDALPEDMGHDLRERAPLLLEEVRVMGRRCMDAVRDRMESQRT